MPWHGEAGQGYGSELLIDCFSNSVNEIELGQASLSAGESHKSLFSCFCTHCASRLVVYSFNSGGTLRAKSVGPAAIRRNGFKSMLSVKDISGPFGHPQLMGVEEADVASCPRGDPCS